MSNAIKFYALAGVNRINIDDDIGKNGISAKKFKQELNGLRGPIEVHINSAGGNVTEGVSIYNSLVAYTGKVTVFIDSLAASMASMIAMAGDDIVMPANALLMIHNPWGASVGDARDLRKTAEVLDLMTDALVAAYVLKSGLSESDVRTLMDNETWFNGNDALEHGFVDAVTGVAETSLQAAKMESICAERDDQLMFARNAHSHDMRVTAQNICTKRKMPAPANLFKSQHTTPTYYTGIKNV